MVNGGRARATSALLIAGQQHGTDWNWINLLGLVAIVASMTNIVSGFLITDRMLKMFKKKEAKTEGGGK